MEIVTDIKKTLTIL